MRRNGYSVAWKDFDRGLERAARLRLLETRLFADPPSAADAPSVDALRGGAMVLMVASLERYLKDCFPEFLDLIEKKARDTQHIKLPTKLVEINDFNFVQWLVKDSRDTRTVKLNELRTAAEKIFRKKFIPESFNRTRSNPGPSTVKELLKDFGIQDPFTPIEIHFLRHYGQPIVSGFVAATLQSIVDKRNEIAHGGSALQISRQDISEGISFMKFFGRSIDNTIRDHCLALVATL